MGDNFWQYHVPINGKAVKYDVYDLGDVIERDIVAAQLMMMSILFPEELETDFNETEENLISFYTGLIENDPTVHKIAKIERMMSDATKMLAYCLRAKKTKEGKKFIDVENVSYARILIELMGVKIEWKTLK